MMVRKEERWHRGTRPAGAHRSWRLSPTGCSFREPSVKTLVGLLRLFATKGRLPKPQCDPFGPNQSARHPTYQAVLEALPPDAGVGDVRRASAHDKKSPATTHDVPVRRSIGSALKSDVD